MVLGGLVFNAAIVAIAAVGWHATSPEVPAEVGTQLMIRLTDGAVPFARMPLGFLTFTVGSLLVAGALWRARAVPRVWRGTFGVLTVSQFIGLPASFLDVAQILIMITFIGMAVVSWRRLLTGSVTP